MPKYKIVIAQFPGNHSTHPDVSDYVGDMIVQLLQHPDFGPGNVTRWRLADTPVTMSRNRCLVTAEEAGADYVLMVDSDMAPDLNYPGAVPFFDAAWAHMKALGKPCVVAAPYCGPPPDEQVYTFQWVQSETGDLNPNFKIRNVGRVEAATLAGVQPAAALATGLMLIDMRAISQLPHPRFYYEWTDEKQTAKASTEDVTFSRDLNMLGVPLFCAWSSWAGHWKLKRVGKPELIPEGAVPAMLTARAAQLAAQQKAAPPTAANRPAQIVRHCTPAAKPPKRTPVKKK